MYRLSVVAVVCFSFFVGSRSEAQNVCRPQPVRQRLMFRLFRRVPTARAPVGPIAVAPVQVCPAPAFSGPGSPLPAGTVMPLVASPMTSVPPAPTATLAPTNASVAPESGVNDVIPTISAIQPQTTSEDIIESPSDTSTAKSVVKSADDKAWRSLFDGKQLGEWKPTKFGGEGTVEVKDQQIKLDFGQYMTGVTHSGKDLPTNNYEIELEAMREDGSDFFCGLTFPADKNFASLICGGWGGSVVGVSSIDDMDASENTTTAYKSFKNKQWYKIRVRVTKGRLQAWIDDQMFVDEEVASDRLGTRIEMDRCQPLGIACFDTQAAVRNVRVREVKEPAKE